MANDQQNSYEAAEQPPDKPNLTSSPPDEDTDLKTNNFEANNNSLPQSNINLKV